MAGSGERSGRTPSEDEAPVLADSLERDRTASAVMHGLFGDRGGAVLANRFRLVEIVGAGAMGTVYLAEDLELGRQVAVKRLSGAPAGQRGERQRARMLQEARALAKVSHPNVVVVHDVRAQDGDVFVAMEFVQGQTLEQWLKADRSLGEILGAFSDAARGLAAAHAAGLVHRDFKPANVLVGDDGRVCVVDFGLARTAEEPPSAPGSLDSASDASSPGGDLVDTDARLTATGALVGTPPYMAPEQLLRGVADARSDQFGFCVSVYEAVHGARPFAGASVRELVAAMLAGPTPPASSSRRVPGWLARVLARGLQVSPEDRFASLAPIIRIIDPHRRQRRRRRLGLVGVGLVSLVTVGIGARITAAGREDPCPPRALDPAVWSEARAAAVTQRIGSAIEADYARPLAVAVGRELDAYARTWVDARQAACVDTYVERVQSEPLFDLRMRCLQRRAAQFGAVVDRLASADETLASAAASVTAKLPALGECADRDRLQHGFARPEDPAAVPVVVTVERLHAEAAAAVVAGALDDAGANLERASQTLADVEWPVMRAELAFLRGKHLAADGKGSEAERALLDATAAAEASSADHLAARAWLQLVWLSANTTRDPERSAFYLERARAAVERIGSPPDLDSSLHQRAASQRIANGDYDAAIASLGVARQRLEAGSGSPMSAASIEMDLGRAHYFKGEYEAAVERFAAAAALFAQVHGPGHPRVASVTANLGSAELLAGRPEDARRHLTAAVDVQRRVYGEDHPRLANSLNALASIDYVQGNFEPALAQYRRVLAIIEGAKGPEHPDLADPLANVGRSLARLGRHAQALVPATRAVAVLEAAKGPEHPDVATALTGLGGVQGGAGQLDAALRSHERALAIREASFGADSAKAAESGVTVADVYRRLEQPEQARRVLQRWLPIMRAKLGASHPHTAPAEVTLGWLELDAGHVERAREAFARAERGLADDTPSTRVLLDLGLAIATFEADEAAARAALEGVASLAADARFASLAADARAFLNAHPGD